MRPIQFYLMSFWRPLKDSLTQSLPVKEALLRHLERWKQPENIFRVVSLQEGQPQCELVDRCFITRLGSPSKRSSDFRHLEFSGEQLLLKLIRNEGCSVSSDSFREHIVEKQSSIEMRQLCYISTGKRGQSPFNCDVGLGDISMEH